MGNEAYSFARLTRADLPLVARWLAAPHVREWWGDPARELAMIEADLGDPGAAPTDMLVVTWQGQPFAYVQDYPAHHWPMPHYAALPEGARAMDTFLGDAAFLGCGHGARYIRQRANGLCAAGATLVVVDPDPSNERAVRAYRRAGFHDQFTAANEDGNPALVMALSPSFLH